MKVVGNSPFILYTKCIDFQIFFWLICFHCPSSWYVKYNTSLHAIPWFQRRGLFHFQEKWKKKKFNVQTLWRVAHNVLLIWLSPSGDQHILKSCNFLISVPIKFRFSLLLFLEMYNDGNLTWGIWFPLIPKLWCTRRPTKTFLQHMTNSLLLSYKFKTILGPSISLCSLGLKLSSCKDLGKCNIFNVRFLINF